MRACPRVTFMSCVYVWLVLLIQQCCCAARLRHHTRQQGSHIHPSSKTSRRKRNDAINREKTLFSINKGGYRYPTELPRRLRLPQIPHLRAWLQKPLKMSTKSRSALWICRSISVSWCMSACLGRLSTQTLHLRHVGNDESPPLSVTLLLHRRPFSLHDVAYIPKLPKLRKEQCKHGSSMAE